MRTCSASIVGLSWQVVLGFPLIPPVRAAQQVAMAPLAEVGVLAVWGL